MPITQNESLKEVWLITEPRLKPRTALSMSRAFFHIKALSVPRWQAQRDTWKCISTGCYIGEGSV